MYTKSLTKYKASKVMTGSGSFLLQLQRAGGWCEPVRKNEPVAYEPSR